MPKGVSIPPRFAEIFCKINRYAIWLSFLVTERAKYPRGKKVISAISFAISIEPINVIDISIINRLLRLPVIRTSFLARIVKNFIFLRAQTTAKVKNRQARVLQSKYDRYSLSKGTKMQVIKAANTAIENTVFFLINLKIGNLVTPY